MCQCHRCHLPCRCSTRGFSALSAPALPHSRASPVLRAPARIRSFLPVSPSAGCNSCNNDENVQQENHCDLPYLFEPPNCLFVRHIYDHSFLAPGRGIERLWRSQNFKWRLCLNSIKRRLKKSALFSWESSFSDRVNRYYNFQRLQNYPHRIPAGKFIHAVVSRDA